MTEELTEEEQNRQKVLILSRKLASVVYALTQVDEYGYIESVIDDLNEQIETGYSIIAQYDNWEVEYE